MGKSTERSSENSHDKYLTALKMGLQVLIAIGFMGALFWVVFFSIHFNEKEPKYTKEELTVGLCAAIFGAVFCIIGIIGIIKESKCIVFILLVLILISLGTNIWAKLYWNVVYNLIIAVLTGALLFFIVLKERHSQPTPSA